MSHAIRASGVFKEYRLGAGNPLFRALGRIFAKGVAAPHFALEDVSFEVAPGEILGVVGRNGAGKTTLLRVLSGVTRATRGRVELPRRTVPLIDLAAGLHPELTGRENVFLSGVLLGMKRAEVQKKFDAIVAFAGLERFLDTPVKKYSSGMLVASFRSGRFAQI